MNLQALDSGLIASELITCDNAENIGSIIQQSLDNVALNDASIKRLQQTITLTTIKPSVKVGNETYVIDPIVLFSRLVVLIIGPMTFPVIAIAYELVPVPTALFMDSMMRKANKSSLAKGPDATSEKKKEEGNITDIESDHQSSDEGDVDDSYTDSDSEDSDDTEIENVKGVN